MALWRRCNLFWLIYLAVVVGLVLLLTLSSSGPSSQGPTCGPSVDTYGVGGCSP